MKPEITIVTPALNQAALLSGVIENIRAQRGVRVQHIVVDGGSVDGTVELLRANDGGITYVSETDSGQAHAINRGFSMAEGDLVGWLNCDDRLTPGALALVVQLFAEAPDVEFLYGDALGVDLAGRTYGLRTHVRPCGLNDLVHLGDPIVQPAAFWTRELGRRIGPLDERFTYAFDYEFWMRAAAVTTLTYVPVCLAMESLHGAAKTSRGDLGRMAEIEAVARGHGGAGVPSGFRAEAAALESIASLKSLVRGSFDDASVHAREVISLRPSVWRYGAHTLALAIPGTHAVPRLRLIANKMRTRRAPLYPTQLDAGLGVSGVKWSGHSAGEGSAWVP